MTSVCTASGVESTKDFVVTVTCADQDTDNVCDRLDACAGVQCQAFYADLPQAGSTIQFAAVYDDYYNIVGPTVEVDGTNRNIEICAGTHTVQRTNSGHALKISNSNGIAGTIQGGQQSDIAFAVGTYNYVCTSHSNMKGVITVTKCSPYICVDKTGDDYQCQQNGQDCGGRGFIGKHCEVCAAGSG